MRRRRAAVGRLLVTYASERRPPTSATAAGDVTVLHEVVRLALSHGVAGFLPTDDWPEQTDRETLAAARAHSLRRHFQILHALKCVAAAFAGTTVPWIVFKGPILAELAYGRPDQRSYEDLDILVPPSGFEVALQTLERSGAVVIDVNWTMVFERMSAEVRLALGPTIIDLHWHLVNQRHLRQRFAIDVSAVFDRRQSVTIAGTLVPTLGPADTLVHTALHAALAGADRLSWLKDVDRLIRSGDIDWQLTIDIARQWHVELPIAGTLWRARRIFGAPVPDDVLSILCPKVWRGILWGAQVVAPVERMTPGRSFSRLVARSARENSRMSAMELLQHSWQAAMNGRRDTWTDHDPASPMSLLHPNGGVVAREAYLRTIGEISEGLRS